MPSSAFYGRRPSLAVRPQGEGDLRPCLRDKPLPILPYMMGDKIATGDIVRCETCRRACTVRTMEWENAIHVIACHEGIRIVGVDHERVPQRLIVSYRRLDDPFV